MGQYYKAILLADDKKTPKAVINPHRTANGLKLMEHSYVGNSFVNDVLNKILFLGGANLVWAGDYADAEPECDQNLYMKTEEPFDCDDPEAIRKSYDEYTARCKYYREHPIQTIVRYVINEDKKTYIDLEDSVKDKYGLRINPLPILTSEGNGRGGGDYRGTCMEMVGTWARDRIAVSAIEPKDYHKSVFWFSEEFN